MANDLEFKAGLDDSRFQSALRRMDSAVKGFVGGLAGGAILGFAKSVADLSGTILDSADALGISVKSYQQLQGVFSEVGVSAQKFDAGLAKLTQSMQDAKTASSASLKALDALGIGYSEIAGKEVEEQLMIVADAMKNAKDPAIALDAAITLLGKSGRNMAAGLKQGSAAIKEAKEQMAVGDEEQMRRLDAQTESLSRKWRSIQMAALPVINAIGSGLGSGIRGVGGFALSLLGAGGEIERVPEPKTLGELAPPPTPIPRGDNPLIADPRDVEATKKRMSEIERINEEWSKTAQRTADEREETERRLQANITKIYAEEAERRRKIGMDELNRELSDKEQFLQQAQSAKDDAMQTLVDFNLASPDERRQARRDALRRGRAQARADRLVKGTARDARPGGEQLVKNVRDAERIVKLAQGEVEKFARAIAIENAKLIVAP